MVMKRLILQNSKRIENLYGISAQVVQKESKSHLQLSDGLESRQRKGAKVQACISGSYRYIKD